MYTSSILSKYIPTIATDNLYVFFILSVHYMFGPLRAILRETQQHHLYIYENHHTTAHPLFYNYSPTWCTSLIIYLSTLQSYNDNSLIK
jgi:hypothetical protein